MWLVTCPHLWNLFPLESHLRQTSVFFQKPYKTVLHGSDFGCAQVQILETEILAYKISTWLYLDTR